MIAPGDKVSRAGPTAGCPVGSPSPPRHRGRPGSPGRGACKGLAVPLTREAASCLGHQLSLPLGVLGRHTADLTGTGSGRARPRSPRRHRCPGRRARPCTRRPPAVHGWSPGPAPLTSGTARTPTHQIKLRFKTFSPVDRCTLSIQGRGDRLAGAHLDAAPPQHPVGGLRQALIELGQQPGRGVQQAATGWAGLRGRVDVFSSRVGQQLALCRDLGAGVARADDDERAARVPFRRDRSRCEASSSCRATWSRRYISASATPRDPWA